MYSNTSDKSQFLALTIDVHGALYAGTDGWGVLKGGIDGNIWKGSGYTLISQCYVYTLAADASGTLYAGTDLGLFKSLNGGLGWSLVFNEFTFTNVLAFTMDKRGVLYAGTNGKGVFISNDGGVTWMALNNGLGNWYVNKLTLDEGGALYAGTREGVFKLDNGGSAWAEIDTGLTSNSVIAMTVDAEGTLYVGTKDGVFKRGNGAGSWTEVNAGLGNTFILSLAVDAKGTLYAGTNGGGVFMSTNGGGAWTALNIGLSNTIVYVLMLDLTGVLYAGTDGGIFQYAAPGISAARFTITGNATGNSPALKLSAEITVAPADTNTSGYLYVIAYVPGSGVYSLTPNGWGPLVFTNVQPYTTAILGTHTIPLLDGSVDVSSLKGTVFYAGYGSDANDMLNNGKYAQIYTIP